LTATLSGVGQSPARQPKPAIRRSWLRPGERALAATAHAAIGFGLLGVGFLLGLAISVVIWLVGHRSRYVAVHAEQAGWYQLAVLVLNVLLGATWLVTLVLVLGNTLGIAGLLGLPSWEASLPVQLTIGLILALALPLYVVWFVATIALGVYGALMVSAGKPFWYPVIGPWVRRRLGEPHS
jgi:hypothetical protein